MTVVTPEHTPTQIELAKVSCRSLLTMPRLIPLVIRRRNGEIKFKYIIAKLTFSIKTLLAVTLTVAMIFGSVSYVFRSFATESGYGPYETVGDWPQILKEIVEDDPNLANEVTPFGLSGFIDHKSIWKTNSNSKLWSRIKESNEFVIASFKHRKANELIKSIPKNWNFRIGDDWTWIATPGYGTIHIEGVDLFLAVEDPKTNELIVLHEWIF